MKSKPSKHPLIQVRGHFVEPANDNVPAHRTYQYHVHIEDQDNHHSQDYDRALYIKSAPTLQHIATAEETLDTGEASAEETTVVPFDSEIKHEAPPGEDAAEKLEQALPAKDQAPPVGLDTDIEQETDTQPVPAEDSVEEMEEILQEEEQDLPEPLVTVIHDEPEDEAAMDDAVESFEYKLVDDYELENISEQAEVQQPSPIAPFMARAAKHQSQLKQKLKQWLSVRPIAMLLGILLVIYLIYVVYKAGTSVSHRLPGIATGPAKNHTINGKQQTIAIPLNPGRQGLPVQPPIDEPGEPYTVVQQQEVIHIVVRGDTLWFIAKRYVNNPLRYPELARLSNIKNPDLIYPSDRVRIFVEK